MRFKVRCVYNMVRFVAILKKNKLDKEKDREKDSTSNMMVEEDEEL